MKLINFQIFIISLCLSLSDSAKAAVMYSSVNDVNNATPRQLRESEETKDQWVAFLLSKMLESGHWKDRFPEVWNSLEDASKIRAIWTPYDVETTIEDISSKNSIKTVLVSLHAPQKKVKRVEQIVFTFDQEGKLTKISKM